MKLKTKVMALLTLGAALIFGSALTASAYFYTPEKCSHIKNMELDKMYNTDHRNNTFNTVGVVNKDANMCYLCGEECSHPEKYRKYKSGEWSDHYYYENGKHYLKYDCTYCNASGTSKSGSPLIDRQKGEKCTGETVQNNQTPGSKPSHTTRCSKCLREVTENCSFKTTYKPYYYRNSGIADSHDIIYKCKSCGGSKAYASHNAKHTMKGDKCTRCGYKILKPGSVKVKSAKQSKAAKKYTVKGGGYSYATYSGTSKIPSSVKWVKPFKVTKKCYPIKITLKSKTTNADAYLVSTNKKFTGNSVQRFAGKSKSFTYQYAVSNSKKPKKVTLYIKAVSKTGNFSKVITKSVKLK